MSAPDYLDLSLIIPIQNSDLSVEIFADELPSTTVLRKVLKDELASAGVWADAACLYMQTKQTQEAVLLLEEAVNMDWTDKKDRVRLLSSTGIALLTSTEEQERQAAEDKFTQAGKLDNFFPMTWMGRGMLNITKEQWDQAKFFFQTTLKECGPVLPALLGAAAVLYHEGDYAGSQAKYGEAIRRHGNMAGAPSRVGFGLACYQLGQVDRAKAAFGRALDMDPECVQAMVGLAVLDMAAFSDDFSAKTERAIKLMSMANLLDHSNAMVQNHLANHYFWKWTPVSGTVTVQPGSDIVLTSQAIPLEAGDPVRIGTHFETIVQEESGEQQFKIAKPWNGLGQDSLKIWKKDYERVFALAKGAYNSTKVKEIQAESLFFLARVYHVRQDTDNACKFYKKACELAPELHPARFGLAQTLTVKGSYDEAQKELEALILISNKAVDALALLGLLQVWSPTNNTKPERLTMGLQNLRKAIELDPLNPELIILEAMAYQQHVSNYQKSLEKYERAVALMKRQGVPIPYELYNNMGVLCQEARQMDKALQFYQQALFAVDESGQAREPALDNRGIKEGELRQEDNHFFFGYCATPVVVELLPLSSNSETAGGTVYDNQSNMVKVLEGREVIKDLIEDGEHIRLGKKFRTKVKKVIEAEDSSILLELSDIYKSNINEENRKEGVDDSNDSKFIRLFVKRENRLLEIPEVTTIAFNLARLHEATGRIIGAIEIHRSLTKRNPAYVNSYLRLACIAVDNGALKECSEWLKIAAASSPGNPEVLTLIGNLHFSLCDWKPAQDVFEGLMSKKIPSVEAYAALGMGNIFFETLHISEQRYTKHLQYASDYYKRILQKDPLNAYAANGLGTVLAEKGEIFKAKEVFNRVREVSEDSMADALLNLGHIYLAQKKHPEALQMYQNYMKRVEDVATPTTSKSRVENLVDVLLYIAFAYFDWARHTELFNDMNAAPADGRYKMAMDHLVTALDKTVSKKEVVLRYNLCMTKLQAANCVLQKLTRNIPRTVEEVEEALQGLEASLSVVEVMLKEKEEGTRKISIKTSTLEDFLKHCRANIVSARSHLDDEKKRAKEEEAEREIRRLAAEAAVREASLKEAMRQAEEQKKQAERDLKAEAKMQKVAELRQGWEQEQAAQKQEKEKKARKKNNMDDFIVDDEPHDHSHGLFGDSDDDRSKNNDNKETNLASDSPRKKKKKSAEELFGDSDDEDADSGDRVIRSKPSATELFGDSEDETSDNEKTLSAQRNTSAPGSSGEEPANRATVDLFGESGDDSESGEELVKREGKREATSETHHDPARKKRRIVEEEQN